MDATDTSSILGDFIGANFDAVNNLNREFKKQKVEIVRLKEELEKIKRQHEDRYDELQVRNVFLHDELQREKTTNATLVQKVASLEKKYEDATTSAASSSFSKFSQDEFKELALRANREHHDLVSELFKTLDNIFETHVSFDKMSVVLEDLVEKRKQHLKAYDEVTDWKRYMKDKPDNVTILTNFQFKKIRTILRAWEDLDETVTEAIKKAQVICSRRWYVANSLMDELSFLAMVLIDKACPPWLLIEQVEQRKDEAEEMIKELDHLSIDDVDRLIKRPFAVEGKIHIYIHLA